MRRQRWRPSKGPPTSAWRLLRKCRGMSALIGPSPRPPSP